MRHFLIVAALTAAAPSLEAASSSDIDKLTTFAVVLGRGVGCGAPGAQDAMKRVGRWMDRKFPPGSSDQKTYLPVLMAGVQENAKAQREGRSPDSCAIVLRNFEKFPWP